MLARPVPWRPIMTSAKKLADLMKVPLVNRSDVSPAEVRRIWHEYHAGRSDAIDTVLEPWRLHRILSLSKSNPMFMFPVHRAGGGFFSMVSQFKYNCCIMTTLDQYERVGNDIPVPHVTVVFYDELCQTKGIGLVRADIAPIITASEARHLLDRLVYYYSSAESNLVRDFNQFSRQFDLDRYLADSRQRWPSLPVGVAVPSAPDDSLPLQT